MSARRLSAESSSSADTASAAAHQERPASDAVSAEELDSALSRLADMRDRRLITPEEFDQKKRELLDRLR